MTQSQREKAIHAQFHKGQEVRIKEGTEDGNFGKITKILERDGKKLLQIKLDRLGNSPEFKGKSITKKPDQIKTIKPVNLKDEFSTAGDFEGKEEWVLSTGDDAKETKEFISDERKDDFENFYIKVKEGDIEEAYGVDDSSGIIFNESPVTRLETASERLERVIV